MEENQVLIRVNHVQRKFPAGNRELHVLKDIEMEIDKGELVILKGRSGSGKTTLLNIIGGLDTPSSGEVYFSDQNLNELSDDERTRLRQKNYGFIFQSFALMPLLSAEENVELGCRLAHVPRSEWKERVATCLELVGLTKRAKHRPFEMSGGEQQRVAIARAIVHHPTFILADEPTAELDSKTAHHVMDIFRQLVKEEGITICMTTHDPTIMEVADHVYEMVDGRLQVQ